jgi:hypothetical protein
MYLYTTNFKFVKKITGSSAYALVLVGGTLALCRILRTNGMCRAENRDLGFLPDNSQYQRNFKKLVPTTVCCDTRMTQVTHFSL